MEVDLLTSGVAEQDSVEVDDYTNTELATNFEAERCGICMDIVVDRGVLDCCQHWFCFVCIDNWATITNLCPLCQNEFQLITCVPVYDTIGTSKVDEDSYSRDDDWCIEGKNNTLSFPSYYIDENAVICLDGDGCKIRNGSAATEEDSNLDTSIACDSCDLWYHAFCVGFDAEGASESTWLCPRCVVDDLPQKPDRNLEQPSNNPPGSGNANSESLSEDTYSRKMSISIADSGETAVVVSMVGGIKVKEEPQDNILPTLDVDQDLKTQTFMLTSENASQKLTTPSDEKSVNLPILKAQELELSLSCDTSTSFPSSCFVNREVMMSVDKSMNEHNNFGGIQSSSGEVVNESHAGNNISGCNAVMGLHLGLSVGTFLSADEMNNNVAEDQMNEGVKLDKPSEEHTSRADKSVADAEEDASGTTGVKRKHSDYRDQIHANANGDVKTKIETEASSKKMRGEARTQPILPMDDSNVSASDNSKKVSLVAVPSNDQLKCLSEQAIAASDIMSIVKGTNHRPSKGLRFRNTDDKSSKELETVAGLRVKKIMKRTAEDKESSMVVQKLRKEIREAVRNKSVKDYGENLFDPKLLAAFRAAVTGPKTESAKTLSHLAVKAKKSMLQKGKVRENLTKKIYAHSNGKRKRAWDRDCEIEFWKHRCLQTSKPEKIQTLKSVLDLLRNGSESTETVKGSERQATDPILSRLYLADTSVFPRKDDIKPLAALKTSGDLEVTNKQPTLAEKCLKSSLDNISSAESDKGQLKVVKKSNANPNLKVNAASSKVHLKRQADGSSPSSLGSSKSNTHKEAAVKSEDVKIDKRKWALEFLARKTSGGGESGANGEQEDIAVLKGNYPLLAQLPVDMRPVLAPSHHNKIPMSVRQAQLYRLTEHLLRKANLPVIRRTAETELAVADAVNIEKEVANKSNSKPVYLNLCSQEILHRSENKSGRGPESDSLSAKVAEMDSALPSTNPSDATEQSGNELSSEIQEALKNAGLLSDSPPNSPDQRSEKPEEGEPSINVNKEGPEDIFEMDNVADLDIYGEFEYNLDDEDYIGVSAAKVSKVQPEEGASKLKLVFSTLHSERSSSNSDVEKTQNLENAEVSNCSSSVLDKHPDVGLINSAMEGGTDNSLFPTEALFGKEGEEPTVAECEELYGPDKEPVIKKLPEGELKKLYGSNDAEIVAENGRPMDCVPNQAIGNESCAEKSGSIGHNSSAGESSPNRSEMSETTRQKEKKFNADSVKRPDNSISKKVEAYIKEHIRPLCKSGVITAEQYRWAVAKTTEKVMKYHCKAKNANFLIKEGEKVKKLAEQYIETAKQKEKGVIYLPKIQSRRHGFYSMPRIHSKGFNFTRTGRPHPLFHRRSPAVSCQSKSESSSKAGEAGKPTDEDFVARVLKENPSQVEPRYLIGDKFYTLKEKEDLNKNSDNGVFGYLVKRLNLGSNLKKVKVESPNENVSEVKDGKNEGEIYLKDILREYRGKLYVPEQVFGTELSEEAEFERDIRALPKMSFEDFLKAMRSNKVKMLTWMEVTSVSNGDDYRDFIIELKEISGDKSLQRRRWAMRLDENQALDLLEEYTGPRYQIEKHTTSWVGKLPEYPSPVASSLSSRIMVELGMVTALMAAAGAVVGGFLASAVFAVTSFVYVTTVFVVWPVVRPFVKLFFGIIFGILGRVSDNVVEFFGDGGILSAFSRFYTFGGLSASIEVLKPITLVLLTMVLLIRFTLSRRPKNFRKWDLWQGIDFSRSKAEARVDGSTGVKFSDVAGIDEAVEELQELVRYLKNPELFDKMGIKPPHGVLLEGPPGCGKTLVAKAIAGEAGVPFYQMAGSEFVEVLVGVGSARIRDLFKRAKVNKPSVIFIDEIDALATRRQGIFKESMDHLYNAATQERETTLNQLLIELDGFDTGKGVIFLAATNRRDLLDPALLRPGRFDRKIRIRPPAAKGRLEILKIHASKVKMSESVELSSYAQNLPGWTGAKLAQLVQEAALVAVRKGHQSILQSDMDDAVDRLTVGPKRVGIELGHQGQCRRATTEVGVAITSHLLRRYENAKVEPCDRISIVPRGQTLSQLVFHRLDDESYMFERRPQLLHRLQVLLGGRAAEEVIYGRDTSRASVDYLADASWLARKILTIWNLENPMCIHGEPPPWRKKAKFVGPRLDFEGSLYDDYGLIEPPLNFNLDDEIAQRTEELIRDMYEKTLSLLQRHHAGLLKTIKVLLDQKEISGEEIDFILDKYPPQTPTSLLLEEDDPGSLPFVRQDESREIEYALVTQSKQETV